MNSKKFINVVKELKKRSVIILLLVAIGLMYLLFDSRGLVKRLSLESRKSSLVRDIKKKEESNDSLRIEIKKLKTDDREIERIAREKYFMHRNGEKIIKVEPKQ